MSNYNNSSKVSDITSICTEIVKKNCEDGQTNMQNAMKELIKALEMEQKKKDDLNALNIEVHEIVSISESILSKPYLVAGGDRRT